VSISKGLAYFIVSKSVCKQPIPVRQCGISSEIVRGSLISLRLLGLVSQPRRGRVVLFEIRSPESGTNCVGEGEENARDRDELEKDCGDTETIEK
jgi:hypothetical protein